MTKFLNILLLLSFAFAKAHTNRIVEKTYGNVNLISSTSYYTEEVNKNIITAKYADLLLKELNYNQPIRLRLTQEREFKCYAYFGNQDYKNEGLNILIFDKETDILKTLNLIQSIILNIKSIEKKEKIDFQKWYNSENTKLVTGILSNKINRPNDVPEVKFSEFFDYFYQDGKYHVLSYQNREVIEVAQMDKILQFSVPTPSLLFVFTEVNSLTIISANYKHDGTKYNPTSETVSFEFQPEWKYSFRPYTIKQLGNKFITIESIFGDKVSLYNIPKKKFTQDLLSKIED